MLQLSNFQVCAEERLAWAHCSSAEVLACLAQLAAFPGSSLTSHHPRGRTCAAHSAHGSKGGDWKEAFKEEEGGK